jgi:hypothetical protein
MANGARPDAACLLRFIVLWKLRDGGEGRMPHRVSAVLHHAPSSVQDSVAMGLCVAQAGTPLQVCAALHVLHPTAHNVVLFPA